jgi:hypothetical protein
VRSVCNVPKGNSVKNLRYFITSEGGIQKGRAFGNIEKRKRDRFLLKYAQNDLFCAKSRLFCAKSRLFCAKLGAKGMHLY